MAGPWDDFSATPQEGSQQPAGPWSEFGSQTTTPSSPTFHAGSPIPPAVEQMIQNGPVGRVLDAFGHGAKQNWGAGNIGLSPESEQYLRKAGVFNDYDNGRTSIIKSVNEAVMRPAAAAVDVANRTFQATIGGAQAAVQQAGTEASAIPGLGENGLNVGRLARDVAAIPEAFPGFGVEIGGLPGTPPRLPASLADARSLNVIGAGGEEAYMGTREAPPPDFDAEAQAAKSSNDMMSEGGPLTGHATPEEAAVQPGTPAIGPEANNAPSPPDIHSIAREIAPDTFSAYDPLVQRQNTFRRWVTELQETKRAEVQASPEMVDLDAKIAAQEARFDNGNFRPTKSFTERLNSLHDQRDQMFADANNSPDILRVRQALVENDEKMRDMAPAVSAAYREADKRLPTPVEAPASGESENVSRETIPEQEAQPVSVASAPEGAPQGTEVGVPTEAAPAAKPIQKQKVSIADDMTKKLVDAGRPQDEAEASAQLIAAHYETRAARFNGMKGTAEELYNTESPEVRAGRQTQALEMAQTQKGRIRLARQAKAVITLSKSADASTFIHETGHAWLEELMGDVLDERAPPQLKADGQTVRDWLGSKEGEEITTRQHEKFARGFEQYMREGVAPSPGLARVFGQFRDWLTKIYQTIKGLGKPISPDIRSVFDRMLAENPDHQPPVIAPERAAAPNFADIHETDARETAPEHAAPAADIVRAEQNNAVRTTIPESGNAVFKGTSDELTGRPAAGEEPSGNGNGTGPNAGEARGGAQSGEIGAGGTDVAGEGGTARGKPTEKVEPLYRKVPKEPERLATFLRRIGGLKDVGGDVRATLGRAMDRPGLIDNKKGIKLDDATHRAWEQGYFPNATERPSIDDLLRALDDDLKGKPKYSAHDDVAGYHEAIAHNTEVDKLASELGIEQKGKSGPEFWAEVGEKMSLKELEDRQTAAAQEAEESMAEAERKAKEWVEKQGDAWEPDEFYGHAESRTLEDLENDRRQEEDARASGTSKGSDIEPGPAAGHQEPVQNSSGQEQSGPWAGRSGPSEGQSLPRAAGGHSTQYPEGPNSRFPQPESDLVDKAGNIRLDNLNTPESVNEVIRLSAEQNGDFIGARRGVISDQQVLDLADALGMDAESISARKLGQAFNAEQIVAARQLLIQSATELRDKMALAAEGDDAAVMAYAEARARHLMIQEQVSGITAEAGRALRAFRSLEGGAEAQALGDFLKDATGKTLFQLKREAQLGMQLDTPQKVSKFMQDSVKPTFGDMVLEYWINGLISGPATHTTYSIGNTLLALWKAGPETAVAAGIGGARRLFGDQGPRVMAGEVPAQLFGMVRGVPRGIMASWEAVKTGKTTLLPGEEEAMGARAMAQSPLTNPKAAIPGPIGTLVRLPARAVATMHSFFRAVNYERELSGLAYRQGSVEGLEGDEFNQRLGELTTNPDADMMQQARQSATDLTLMGKGGELTQALSKLTNAKFLGFQWLKFIDPFVHISSNVIEQSFLQRSPMGFLAPEIRANVLGANGPVARDMAIARMAVGTTLGVGIGALAAEGVISGSGPSDPKEAAVWRLTGNQAHSVKVGDVWYDIHRLGPLGMNVGIAADLYEVAHMIGKEDGSKVASALAHAFTQNILDESFMRGPAELIQALTDSQRYGQGYVRNFLSSFVPYSVGMGQEARAIDPYSRQARTILDAVKAKTPWLSETLLPRRDVWGEPIPNKSALGVAGLTAIYESRINGDPANLALQRLGIFPALPERKIRGVQLTDKQYDDYSRIAGRAAKMRMDAITKTPGFATLPQETQREMATDAIRSSRETARALVMMQNPDIIRQAMQNKVASVRKGATVH